MQAGVLPEISGPVNKTSQLCNFCFVHWAWDLRQLWHKVRIRWCFLSFIITWWRCDFQHNYINISGVNLHSWNLENNIEIRCILATWCDFLKSNNNYENQLLNEVVIRVKHLKRIIWFNSGFLIVSCKGDGVSIIFFKYEEMEADSLKLSLTYQTRLDAAQCGRNSLNVIGERSKRRQQLSVLMVRSSYQSFLRWTVLFGWQDSLVHVSNVKTTFRQMKPSNCWSPCDHAKTASQLSEPQFSSHWRTEQIPLLINF